MDQLINAVSGPFGALALSVAILWWLANKIVPIIQAYLEKQNDRLGDLVRAIEKTVNAHEADRKTFEKALTNLSTRLGRVEEDLSTIKEKLQ